LLHVTIFKIFVAMCVCVHVLGVENFKIWELFATHSKTW